ncbi:Gfo/Idh/MocA family oxidoreductase [soil metagenome]
MVNLGIIGCGDVATRTYFPALLELGESAQVTAVFDVVGERAANAAKTFVGSTPYTTLNELLKHPGLDGVLNLTPAPFHRDTTSAALSAGLHVLSEKPIAGSVAEAQDLIAQAKAAGRNLLVAPAVMATNRFRWLRDVLGNGKLGTISFATGQYGTMGPAGWRQYTGDPSVFYAANVGPVLDLGVYPLHGVTGLLGPVKRIQAFGGIQIPERTVQIRRLAGKKIDVASNDVVMMHLDFGGTFASMIASYAIPGTRAPMLEIHGSKGSFSLSTERFYDAKGPVEFRFLDDTLLGIDGWMDNVRNPEQDGTGDLIGAGAAHFVSVMKGEEEPILTAEHATHILEIILTAKRSIDEGRAIELETTFTQSKVNPA